MSQLSGRLAATFLILVVALAACGGEPPPSGPGSLAPSGAASASVPASSGSTPSAEATSGASAGADATTYTVQPGDTLFSIARSWDTSVAQLQAWNSDRYPSLAGDADGLEAGWVLVVADEAGATAQPTASPTQRATPVPSPPPVSSGCRAGNRVAAGNPQTYYVVPGAGRGVALTFDMGGRLDPGVDILSFLIQHRVCATLFPTGAMAQTPQGREIMAIVRQHPELFEIGNHTMHHCDLVRGGGGSPTLAPCAGVTPTAQFIRRQLADAEAILRNLSGQNPQPYWRPPYGSINGSVLQAAASAGYTKTFMWDIDTIDWKPISEGGPTAEQIAAKVITTAEGGSNVLMHLGGYETLDALRIMVPGLRDRGFTLTSLSDLLN
jgi:peptidoglycan/xylan/chitin deacetylase (PgdA/CDA1 family)/LysM repeat protein